MGPVSIPSERHQYFEVLGAVAHLLQVVDLTSVTIGDPGCGYLGVTDIDEEIPPEHYKVVAEVISYVFQLKNKPLG